MRIRTKVLPPRHRWIRVSDLDFCKPEDLKPLLETNRIEFEGLVSWDTPTDGRVTTADHVIMLAQDIAPGSRADTLEEALQELRLNYGHRRTKPTPEPVCGEIEKKSLSPKEVSKYFSAGLSSVYRWLSKGLPNSENRPIPLKNSKDANGRTVVFTEDIAAWLNVLQLGNVHGEAYLASKQP